MTTDFVIDFIRGRLDDNAEGTLSAADVVSDICDIIQQYDSECSPT